MSVGRKANVTDLRFFTKSALLRMCQQSHEGTELRETEKRVSLDQLTDLLLVLTSLLCSFCIRMISDEVLSSSPSRNAQLSRTLRIGESKCSRKMRMMDVEQTRAGTVRPTCRSRSDKEIEEIPKLSRIRCKADFWGYSKATYFGYYSTNTVSTKLQFKHTIDRRYKKEFCPSKVQRLKRCGRQTLRPVEVAKTGTSVLATATVDSAFLPRLYDSLGTSSTSV